MFIVKGKNSRSLHGFNTTAAPVGTRWCWQKNGWMDDSIGERWFNEVFLQFWGSERPQLLILDGHSSHETLVILIQAMDEGIYILALPPHTTHSLQPLDKAVFGPLNRAYNEVCSEYLQENALHQINKWSFPALFWKSWDKAVTRANICSGFRACGIYPLDRTIIPEKLYSPSEPTDKPLPEEPVGIDESAAIATVEAEATTATLSDDILVASPLQASLSIPMASGDYSLDPYLNATSEGFDTSFEYVYNDATVSHIKRVVDLQVQPDVLDRSDPLQ